MPSTRLQTQPLSVESDKASITCLYHNNDIMGLSYLRDEEDYRILIPPFTKLPPVGYLRANRETMKYEYLRQVNSLQVSTSEYPLIYNPAPGYGDSLISSVFYVRLTRNEIPRTTLTQEVNLPWSTPLEPLIQVESTYGFPYEFVGQLGIQLVRLRVKDRTSFSIIFPSDGDVVENYGNVSTPDRYYFLNGDGSRTYLAGTTLSLHSYGPAFPPFTYGAYSEMEGTVDNLTRTTVTFDSDIGMADAFVSRLYEYLPSVYWEADTSNTLKRFMVSLAPFFRALEQDMNLLDEVNYREATPAWLPYLVRNFGWDIKTTDPDIWRWQARYAFSLFKDKGRVRELKSLLKLLYTKFTYLERWRDCLGNLSSYEPEFLDWNLRPDVLLATGQKDWQYYNSYKSGFLSDTNIRTDLPLPANQVQDFGLYLENVNDLVSPIDTYVLQDNTGTDFEITASTASMAGAQGDILKIEYDASKDTTYFSTTAGVWAGAGPWAFSPADPTNWEVDQWYTPQSQYLALVNGYYYRITGNSSTAFLVTKFNATDPNPVVTTVSIVKRFSRLQTYAPHGMLTGDVVEIYNTYNYNGEYVVTKLDEDYFQIVAPPAFTSETSGKYITPDFENSSLLTLSLPVIFSDVGSATPGSWNSYTYTVGESSFWNVNVWSNSGEFVLKAGDYYYTILSNTDTSITVTKRIPSDPVPSGTEIEVARIPIVGPYIIYKQNSGEPKRVWRGQFDGTTRAPVLLPSESEDILAGLNVECSLTSICAGGRTLTFCPEVLGATGSTGEYAPGVDPTKVDRVYCHFNMEVDSLTLTLQEDIDTTLEIELSDIDLDAYPFPKIAHLAIVGNVVGISELTELYTYDGPIIAEDEASDVAPKSIIYSLPASLYASVVSGETYSLSLSVSPLDAITYCQFLPKTKVVNLTLIKN